MGGITTPAELITTTSDIKQAIGWPVFWTLSNTSLAFSKHVFLRCSVDFKWFTVRTRKSSVWNNVIPLRAWGSKYSLSRVTSGSGIRWIWSFFPCRSALETLNGKIWSLIIINSHYLTQILDTTLVLKSMLVNKFPW